MTRPKQFGNNSDVITHFFLPEAYMCGMVTAKLARHKGPLLMSRLSLNNYQKKYPFLSKIEHHLHKYCHLILINSKAAQKQLIEEEKVLSEKTILIYSGVNEKRFLLRDKVSYRKELGFLPHQFIIICLASFIPYKGHVDLINGLSQIKNELPHNWRALFIGKDNKKSGYNQKLKEMTRQHNLSENICFIENCEDPDPFLLASDLGILPSHQEGFPNAIIEMLAAGLPIIATHVGGIPEAVIHEKNGLLIRPHCPDDIAHSILHFAKDENLRKKYGEHNYQVFLNNYTLNKCVEEYEKVYKSCYNVKN
jgi:glycosyltransferase involved in cell wall biosynthesis